MHCPTVTLRNRFSKETMVVDADKYASGFYAHLCDLDGSGDWERISETNAGGDEGFKESQEIRNTVLHIKEKRKKQPLRKKK